MKELSINEVTLVSGGYTNLETVLGCGAVGTVVGAASGLGYALLHQAPAMTIGASIGNGIGTAFGLLGGGAAGLVGGLVIGTAIAAYGYYYS